jgi:hypothetical protein
MNKVDAGHACPVSFARRGGMRLIEGTSPKLQRRVRLYSYANFAIWIGLEASPEVTAFCEYPVRTGPNTSDPIVDFWVRTKDRDEYLVSPDHPSGIDWPAQLNGRTLRQVTDAEIAASGQFVRNWEFILSALNGQEPISDAHGLVKKIANTVQSPMTLAEIERQNSSSGTPLVRACVFHLLRMGRLSAPSLRDQSLSNLTVLVTP